MDRETVAKLLDGSQYRQEGSRELWAEMEDAGLVAVFGASDDLMEFRGAIYDEIGAYGGATAYVTSDGLFENECEEDCPYAAKARESATMIDAIWAEGDYSWQFDTVIPHSKFVVKEDDEPYCEGIVFALADVPA